MTWHKFSKKLGLAALVVGTAFVGGCNGGGTDNGTTGATATTATATTTGGTTATTGTTGASASNEATPARPTPPVDGPKADGDTIKIGMIGSITGDQKPWGEDSIDGAKMALADFNKGGGIPGKKIELEIGDSGSKPEPALTAAETVISKGVIGIVGEVASGNTLQIAKSAFAKGIPVMAIGATKTALTAEGTNVFRVCYTDDEQGPVMTKFAFDKLGKKKIAVMTDNATPYSQGLSASFIKYFTDQLHGEIVIEEKYEGGQTQFSSQITELKAKQPDAVFISGYFNDVGPIAQQLRQAGVTVPLLGGDGWDSEQILTSGGKAIMDSYFCNHYNNADNRPQVATFLTEYKGAHGGKVPGTTMAALGYDAMALMLDALKRAKATDAKSLIAALEDTTGYKGITGDITLKGMNGNPPKRAIVVQIVPKDAEGQWQKYAIAYTPDELGLK